MNNLMMESKNMWLKVLIYNFCLTVTVIAYGKHVVKCLMKIKMQNTFNILWENSKQN